MTLRERWEVRYLVAEAERKLLVSHNQDLKEMALAAAATGVNVQVGDQHVEDKSFRGKVTNYGQIGSVTGDVRGLTQTLTAAGGESAGLAAAVEALAAAIGESRALSAPEKKEAADAVKTVATAAVEVAKDSSWSAAAGKAIERLTGLLGKAPDLTKLVEALGKAWEAVAKSLGG